MTPAGNRPRGAARRGLITVVGAALAMAGLSSVSPTTAHAALTTYYFHGTATDDANRQQVLLGQAQPTATFDTTAPTATTPVGFTQTGTPPANQDDAGNALAVYWYAPFTGTVNGSIAFDWWWSSNNPTAIALGSPMTVTVFADPTLEAVSPAIAQSTVTLNVSPTPTENKNIIPLKNTCPCPVTGHLLIQVSTASADTGHEITAHYDSTAVASQFQVGTGTSTPPPTPTATPAPTPGPGQGGTQLFHNYQAPYPYPHNPPQPSAVALLFGEPSIGVDWGSNNTMYQGDLNTWQVQFAYAKGVIPTATWNDRSDVATDVSSLDARLITDHAGRPLDRTFVEQLHLATSAQAYSDTDGGTAAPPANSGDWVAGNSGLNGGVDHESIGAGRYSAYVAPPAGAGVAYPHAFYYCAQDTAQNAYCTRSDDGGVTYGAPAVIFSTSNCGPHLIHGKPVVGPDGVVYVPNADCGGQKAVSISTDNGATFTVVKIPGTSTDGNQFDPVIAIGGITGKGTLYYSYRDGDHHAKVVTSTDGGTTWSTPIDLGSFFGLETTQFPASAAGDANRAAVSFLGTTTKATSTGGQGDANDDLSDNFGCAAGKSPALCAVWHMYTAFTYDGGKNWQVVDSTPNDPVQRGGICAGGTGCTGSDRNMLDFNDATIDNHGRFQVAYTDGCTGACETDPNAASCSVGNQNCTGKFSSVFSMVNQTCGMGLFAKYDPGFNNDPNCVLAVNTPEVPVTTVLIVGGGIVAIAIGLSTRRRRRDAPGLPA